MDSGDTNRTALHPQPPRPQVAPPQEDEKMEATRAAEASSHDNLEHTEQTPLTDTVEAVKKSTRSEDHPMGETQPQAPFAFVAMSYFAALVVVGLIFGWLYFVVL